MGKEHTQNKKIANLIKQSHIQIGENQKFYAGTTQASDYNKKSLEVGKVEAAKMAQADLRKSHFAFGSDRVGPESFTTTNMDRFKRSTVSAGAIKPTIPENNQKGPNIVYGQSKPEY